MPAAAVGLDVQVAQLAPPAYALSAAFAIAPAATPATPISPFAYAPERAVAGAGGVTPEVNRQLRPCAVPPLALPLSAQSGSPADCSAYSERAQSCSPVDYSHSARGSAGSAACERSDSAVSLASGWLSTGTSTRPVAVAIAVPLYDRPTGVPPGHARDGAAGGGPDGEAAQAGMDLTTPPASLSSTMPSGSDEEAEGETAYV